MTGMYKYEQRSHYKLCVHITQLVKYRLGHGDWFVNSSWKHKAASQLHQYRGHSYHNINGLGVVL